jgi:crotonobetainyl-CoA:carnitine CoA-transferase CaiB-like acyl-CoA transferase
LVNRAASCLAIGKSSVCRGKARSNIVPYQAFAVRDGHVVPVASNDAQFARFVEVLGVPRLAQDSRFSTNSARLERRDERVAMLSASLANVQPPSCWPHQR